MTWTGEWAKPGRALAVAAGFMTALALHVAACALTVHSVGAVTRHASGYVGHEVVMSGYVLARRSGYVLFSDEPDGAISRYDLPVVGKGIAQMKPRTRYIIQGKFLDHGLVASNGNPDHLQLSAPPRKAQP